MSVTTTKFRWTPVRNGPIYCSPACGGKCTWQAHVTAKRAAMAMCRKLGSGWTPRVFENLGWHWEVRLQVHEGTLTVWPSVNRQKRTPRVTGYVASLMAHRQWWAGKDTVEEAISTILEAATKENSSVQRVLAEVKDLLRTPKPRGPQLYVTETGRIVGEQTDIEDYVKEKKA